MNSLIELAKQALDQSNQMEEFAKQAQWEELTELQGKHSQTVEKIMFAEAEDSIKAELRTLLIEVKTTNNRTMKLADTHKKSLVKEKKTMGKAAAMQKALDALK
ncbi:MULTISPECIES: hypothetical protein [unclassified Neptuniibacter]|uniref:hypothetical protein n=1 Tax=unclassified Neptuniibacter TaxID=2630693 RepID=UPI000C5E8FFE|nr:MULTISPECIES: hypothetical protein [unclassified Neptuniibacter]MAY40943.1 hypothetical protein [Oceanospirillaceae bacterium]|tara:strand:+ start:39639 stop:39950 length:312 start_codon:yes stop_codon:yes gene_type:complete